MGMVPRTTYICINRLATSISGLYKQEPVHTINLIRNITIKDGKCEAMGTVAQRCPVVKYILLFVSFVREC